MANTTLFSDNNCMPTPHACHAVGRVDAREIMTAQSAWFPTHDAGQTFCVDRVSHGPNGTARHFTRAAAELSMHPSPPCIMTRPPPGPTIALSGNPTYSHSFYLVNSTTTKPHINFFDARHWLEGNEFSTKGTHFSNVPKVPNRFKLTGPNAEAYQSGRRNRDNDDELEEEEAKKAEGKKPERNTFRPEVNPAETALLVLRYSQLGETMVDSTSGTGNAAIAALRLGRCVDLAVRLNSPHVSDRRCAMFERDTTHESEMFKCATQRLAQAYLFLLDHGLLPTTGVEPAPVTSWEYKGKLWLWKWGQEIRVPMQVCVRVHMQSMLGGRTWDDPQGGQREAEENDERGGGEVQGEGD
jgi:hypothetical protein